MKDSLWLHRALITGPYLCLVRCEADFQQIIKKAGVTDPIRWLGVNAAATTTDVKNRDNERISVVSLRPDIEASRSPIQIAALLCHEAVHVFQNHCEAIGEEKPSDEFQAYAIEQIALRLMFAYTREIKEQPSDHPPDLTMRPYVAIKKGAKK